jgi:hypothetical protein
LLICWFARVGIWYVDDWSLLTVFDTHDGNRLQVDLQLVSSNLMNPVPFLQILNIKRQLQELLVNGHQHAGLHQISWNRKKPGGGACSVEFILVG